MWYVIVSIPDLCSFSYCVISQLRVFRNFWLPLLNEEGDSEQDKKIILLSLV